VDFFTHFNPMSTTNHCAHNIGVSKINQDGGFCGSVSGFAIVYEIFLSRKEKLFYLNDYIIFLMLKAEIAALY
jgi:hypothetical protein